MLNLKANHSRALLLNALVIAMTLSAPTNAATDPVVLTFSTVGDSRQDPQNIDPSIKDASMVGVGKCALPSGATGLTANPGLSGQDCKWLQNTRAWSRIMRTIQSQKANLLFFNGDMIMGYGKAGVPVARTSNGLLENPIANPSVSDVVTSDLMQFYQQYGFWRGMVANLMESGTYVVPVPGNHETQCKRCNKAAQVENENAWRDNMGDLILDQARVSSIIGVAPQNWSLSNAPTLATDGLTTDQKQLSYSFDIGSSHFAVINTDPVGNDGHAPSNWLDADMATAKSHGATNFFVFGHKAAFFYNYVGSAPSSTSSLNDKDPAAANTFWNVISKYNATYFCGHEHIYKVDKLFSKEGNAAYQVLVGAGGSPFETSVPTFVANDRMYSWATVKILKSGKVLMDTYGFDASMANPVLKLETIQLPTAQ
jgi:hypothetical protein